MQEAEKNVARHTADSFWYSIKAIASKLSYIKKPLRIYSPM
jgi:hypothetical protein